MEPIFPAMEAAAELTGVRYAVAAGRPILYLMVEGDNGDLTCVGEAMETERVAAYYTRLARVPKPRRQAVVEYLTRVNAGLVIGNFDLDMYSGMVRFKTALPGGDAAIAPEHLAALMRANVLTADRYLPGLLAVIYGQVPPGDALDGIETFALEEVLGAANEQF